VYNFLDGAEYVVQRNGKAFFEEFHPKKSTVAEIVAAVKAVVYTTSDRSMPFWLDDSLVDAGTGPETGILPMENGLLDTTNRLLLPVTPNFFCPYALPYGFDEDAPAPARFLSFLNELWLMTKSRNGCYRSSSDTRWYPTRHIKRCCSSWVLRGLGRESSGD
jgi:hypothetical protein